MMRGKRWTEGEIALVRSTYPVSGLDGCAAAITDRSRGAIAQLAFRLGVRVTENIKTRWTATELDILDRIFPIEGADACAALLPARNIPGIRMQALKRELKDPTAIPAGRRAPLEGHDLSRAVELRKAGWSYARIGREFGVCESTATNALTYAECIAAGRTPAKRDAAGGLYARDAKRLRKMLLDGMKHVEIQRELGISASCVSHYRRRLEKDLRGARKSKLLPQHGGGAAYSGRKFSPALKREAERLYMTGLGTKKVSEATGISHSQCLRIRNKLVSRLRRRGEALQGCDLDGRRRITAPGVRAIPADAIAELRRRLVAREPVARAARDLGIGGCSAYRIRDELAAEFAARGEALPPPIRPGTDHRAARRASWMPEGKFSRFRHLRQTMSHDDAKAAVLREAAEERRAEAQRPKSFEEQLALVGAGARLSRVVEVRRAAPDMTLGGVATGAL